MWKLWRYAVVLVALVVSSALATAQQTEPTLNLMPVPKSLELTGGQFRLNDSFTMEITGNAKQRLYRYASRILRRLSGRTGLFFDQDYITPETQPQNPSMIIHADHPDTVRLGMDESYHLEITADAIRLTAHTDIGAMRGLETFLQLLSNDPGGYYFPGVTIQDAPRFPWRGLLLDVGRHFMPVKVVKRNLDGLAAMKMNVLHWHLTEDQGFRVESKTFPKLQQLGSDGKYYTQDQIKDIIRYARDRGIRIVPEFDMPGHTTSWFVGYPELASAPGPYHISRTWGIHNAAMDPTKDSTYEFLDQFFAEMSRLFPDEYMHIGGDEVNGKQWDANQDIQAFMKAHNIPDNHQLQAYFNKRILQILTKYNKRMVGWEEILQPGLPKNIVIQSWLGTKSLVEAAKKGYQSMLSNGYYIDLVQPTSYHYLNDPVPGDADLTPEEQQLILGGEATMWSELVTPETVDSRIWPRTAAIAERFWSPADVRDVADMYRRLKPVSLHLEELGLTHLKNYGMMLRRLTNGDDITALKTLVDVVEPVEGYARHRRPYTSYSPYTRVVDAARPDAAVARHFRNLVADYLQDPTREKAGQIKVWLARWKNNHETLMETIGHSPVLREIAPLSETLRDVAGVGLEAIDYLQTESTPPADWLDTNMVILQNAEKPQAEVELRIVSAVEKLATTVGAQK